MTSGNGERLGKASEPARRLLAVLVGLLLTTLALVSGAASAVAQNVVGPQPVFSILTVGPHPTAGQSIVGVRGPPLHQHASATGVAAEAGDGAAADLAKAGCGESFSADTEVVMADGSTKPLDQVKVGDKVEATDAKTGKTTAKTVTAVMVNHDTDLMNVNILAGGKTSTIHATQHHLFWDTTRGAWVEADHLAAGDRLRTDRGQIAAVASTVVVPGAADRWDLTVAGDHDFYVVTTVANVLVHNCSWPKANATNSNCDACAAQIQKQIGGDVVRITPRGGAPRLGPSVGDPSGDWAYHAVVVKDGLVYDARTASGGLSIDQYKAQFQYSGDINFGF